MGYSDAEIRAFKEKDRRIVRQSSLKVAADLVVAADKGKSNLATLNLATQTVAQELADWVYERDQDVDTKPEPNTGLGNTPGATLGQLPEPTLQQKKVLDAIREKTGLVSPEDIHGIQTAVLKWAEEVHGQRAYPTKLNSVETFLKWFKTL